VLSRNPLAVAFAGMRLAHISDVHFGRIAHPDIVAALTQEINAAAVDAVILSGDLTQRARKREYKAAAALLSAFEAPALVVPGNHDVYPWWHPIKRLRTPLTRFRRYIDANPSPTLEQPGLAVLGINSAHGYTIKGGTIGADERAAIRRYFAKQPPEVFKVLVVHHHLITLEVEGGHDVARHARRTLERAIAHNVDLILCGHLHISHVEPITLSDRAHQLVIASAGTATSDRGRGSNKSTNYFNLITVTDDTFTIAEHRFVSEDGRFVEARTADFPRMTPAPSSSPNTAA